MCQGLVYYYVGIYCDDYLVVVDWFVVQGQFVLVVLIGFVYYQVVVVEMFVGYWYVVVLQVVCGSEQVYGLIGEFFQD